VSVFVLYLDQRFGISPLWLCPLKPDRKAWLAPNFLPEEAVINVGVWGPFKGDYETFVYANKELEEKLHQLGGRKVLYAHAYYTEEEFWDIYDRKQYSTLRTSYMANDTFNTLFDKVVVKHRYKQSLLRGWLALIRKS
jgi:delta24-sterol reductase